jgi:hypothetical protein
MGVEKLRKEKKKWVGNMRRLLRQNISGQIRNLPDADKDNIINEVINQCLMLKLNSILSQVVKKQTA